MTPEERERFTERMRARGFSTSGGEQADAGTASNAAPGARQRSQAPAAAPAQSAPARSNATTFDALFGPLAPTETFGQVWLYVDAKLQRVRLRLGITDGQQTELLQALDGDVQEDTEVVTNVITGAVRQAPAPAGNAFPRHGGPAARAGLAAAAAGAAEG